MIVFGNEKSKHEDIEVLKDLGRKKFIIKIRSLVDNTRDKRINEFIKK